MAYQHATQALRGSLWQRIINVPSGKLHGALIDLAIEQGFTSAQGREALVHIVKEGDAIFSLDSEHRVIVRAVRGGGVADD